MVGKKSSPYSNAPRNRLFERSLYYKSNAPSRTSRQRFICQFVCALSRRSRLVWVILGVCCYSHLNYNYYLTSWLACSISFFCAEKIVCIRVIRYLGLFGYFDSNAKKRVSCMEFYSTSVRKRRRAKDTHGEQRAAYL